MKKTLVALAVAAVAASASATTVYNQDGTKVELGGYVDIMLGKFGDSQRTDLRNNESRVEVKVEHEIQNGLKALGFYRLRFDDASNGDRWDSTNTFANPTTNQLWLGLEHADVGRVTFGKQDTTGDAVQLNNHTYIFGGNNNLFDGSDKVVSFRSADFKLAEGQTLGFGLDYVFGQSNKKYLTKDELKNGYGVSLFYAGSFGDFSANVNAGYTVNNKDLGKNGNNHPASTNKQEKAWRVATQFDFGPASLGVEYGQTKFTSKDKSEEGTARFIEVGAKYNVLPEVSSVYAQWQRNSFKGDAGGFGAGYKLSKVALSSPDFSANLAYNEKATQNVYILGADYAFNKNVVAYAEYANSRVKTKEDKVKESFYGTGLRVYF
ncbi:porin [Canicola haemoglobinophilus]|uniref:Porin n=1 Tax=Canicola haemoglobinophilus TaxID=733 RepID=A0AB38HAG6_9PAST|nr:porin [Canicola haemoglobinophilus]STO53743.1 porin [Canicola haemoglobinophilus]STO68276.1 porin [Canicola haemoglobinophilus]